MKNSEQHYIGYLYILLAGISWGLGGMYVKWLGLMGVSGNLTAFMCCAMGAAFLFPYLIATQGIKGLSISKQGLFHAFLLGVMTKGFFKMAYNGAIIRVGVSTGAVLLYTSPIFVALLSRLFFKEKITARKWLAIAINILGCFLMVTGGQLNNLVLDITGIILGLVAAILFSMQSIFGKISASSTDPVTLAFYMLFFASLILIPFVNFTAEVSFFTDNMFWIHSLGYGFIPTAFANVVFLKGQSYQLELSRIPVLTSMEVVVSTITGILIFHEQSNLWTLIGLGAILFAIAMMNMKKEPIG